MHNLWLAFYLEARLASDGWKNKLTIPYCREKLSCRGLLIGIVAVIQRLTHKIIASVALVVNWEFMKVREVEDAYAVASSVTQKKL